MYSFDSNEVTRLIRTRRSVYPQQFSGEIIPREMVETLLENAHYAPTHGRTEPWHFLVYAGEGRRHFGELHADLYRTHTPEEKFKEDTYEKMKLRPMECSHFIVICMKRGNKPNIPAWEELAATACAVQNLHLSAVSLGLAGYWGSGGMTNHPSLREALGLGDEDQVLGFFHLGMPKDETLPPAQRSDWREKTHWVEDYVM